MMAMKELLDTRFSTRAFLKTPVEDALLTEIFETAQRAPSNCNVQPWQSKVVSGKTRQILSEKLVTLASSGATPNPDFNWAIRYQGVHRERQFGSATALYSAMGIAREDKMARSMAMIRNWQFFGAPHVVFFCMEKYMDIMGAVDVGIYAQTLSLILEEKGVSSCMQGALSQFPGPICEMLGLGETEGVLFGMSFGYADPDHPANKARTDRANLVEAVQFFT